MRPDDAHDTDQVSSNPDLVDALVQTTFTTMAVLSGIAADNDLSLTQLRVLAILRDRQVRISRLASYLGLDRSTLSGLIDRAATRGLVERRVNSADGRVVDVTLSPAGEDLARQLSTQIAQCLGPTMEKLSSSERDRLTALLQRLLA